MKIESLVAYWILDSRGNPTIEVSMKSKGYKEHGASPSGASTGKNEALELRDNAKDFHGKGVSEAIEKINQIKSKIVGKEFSSPKEFDDYVSELDGTDNKSNLGGNSTTALSIAFYKLFAKVNSKSLASLFGEKGFPLPMFNIINGGKHAGNDLAIQEFMIVPRFDEVRENIKCASEVYHQLKKDISRKYGKIYTSVGDEGGFAPPIKEAGEAIELIKNSIEEIGYDNVDISLDSAADSFYKDGKYAIDGNVLEKGELVDYYLELSKNYKLLSIEDPFYEEDMDAFIELRKRANFLIIGDDLTVTNPKIIEEAANKEAIDGVIIKINQIGSVSQAVEAIKMCKEKELKRIVSHRSGETEDSFIANFAFGNAVEFIKTGAPARGERTSKYNELIRLSIKE